MISSVRLSKSLLHQQKEAALAVASFCCRSAQWRESKTDRLSRRLHNQAKQVGEFTLQRASADCSVSASHSDAKRTAPRTYVLAARKEYNRSGCSLQGTGHRNIDTCVKIIDRFYIEKFFCTWYNKLSTIYGRLGCVYSFKCKQRKSEH